MIRRNLISLLLLALFVSACGGGAEDPPTIAPTAEGADTGDTAEPPVLNITVVAPPEVEGLVVPVSTDTNEFEIVLPNEDEAWSLAEDGTSTITNGDVTVEVFVLTFAESGERAELAEERYPGADVETVEDAPQPTYIVTAETEGIYEVYSAYNAGLVVVGVTVTDGDGEAARDALLALLEGLNIVQVS